MIKVQRNTWNVWSGGGRGANRDGGGIALKDLDTVCGSTNFLNKLQELHSHSNVAQMVEAAMSSNIVESNSLENHFHNDTVEETGERGSDIEEDYEIIDRSQAVEAMAFYIAEVLCRCPQATNIPPKKLQEAVLVAINGIKQSHFKRLCSTGRSAYRWGALAYSGFQVYQNPWIIQAIITAILTFSRLTLRNWI